MYASGCAVVRAFPTFSRKTGGGANGSRDRESKEHIVNVEFICPDGDGVTHEDLAPLRHAAGGIQMTARIVDTPCNEMHTDAFLDVNTSNFKFLSPNFIFLPPDCP